MLGEILGKIKYRGWNVYEFDNHLEPLEKLIGRGPAEQLKLEKTYVMIPRVENPRSVAQVKSSVEMGIYPTLGAAQIIRVGKHAMDASVFHLDGDVFLVLEGEHLSYGDFIRALETLPRTFGQN